ncbi:hypothetical protein GF359_03545 [candidate division WOR-3 bacterium]|uniref:Uncharacterized protein n=1 Tax=candidate division WOR-3 bacterium TaxID=2052148 RepID=A0A9D5K8W1_UNCW3|nr:hypothetical protein [candidate division WOR-3 bacterium]MBD3364269.1 hypothetical protein [candidate division WOR-3 bacterium]
MKLTIRVMIGLIGLAGFTFAHKPLENPSSSSDFHHAIQIEDPDVSYVVYHQVTEERPRVWLTLEAEAGYMLYVSLGVPVIERLTDYRPAVAVIGPGLPDKEFDLHTPEDMGAVIFETDDIDDPRFFHEPFTGTDSWIYIEEWVRLPETGTYYVVAYHPENTPGKLWVAPGTKEKWGIIDIFKLPSIVNPVREFHER